MIQKITINNYKCFEHLEVAGLFPVTLIGGPNNVGKTSFLEAIFLFYDRISADMLLKHSIWRGVQSIKLEPDLMWGPVFSKYDMSREIVISLSGDRDETLQFRVNENYTPRYSVNKPKGKEFQISRSSTSSHTFISAIDIDAFENGKQVQSSHLVMSIRDGVKEIGHEIEYASSSNKAARILPSIYINPVEDAQLYGQLDVKGNEDVILGFLSIIEPRLRGLSTVAVSDNSTILHGDIGNGRKIPLPYMGDGMRRLLSIILAIATTENGVVLIDEIENGLHHSIMPKIWKGIAAASLRFNCQVIATTHSDECINSALTGFAENQISFGYVRLDRNRESAIVPKVYPYEVLKAALEMNWEVR